MNNAAAGKRDTFFGLTLASWILGTGAGTGMRYAMGIPNQLPGLGAYSDCMGFVPVGVGILFGFAAYALTGSKRTGLMTGIGTGLATTAMMIGAGSTYAPLFISIGVVIGVLTTLGLLGVGIAYGLRARPATLTPKLPGTQP